MGGTNCFTAYIFCTFTVQTDVEVTTCFRGVSNALRYSSFWSHYCSTIWWLLPQMCMSFTSEPGCSLRQGMGASCASPFFSLPFSSSFLWYPRILIKWLKQDTNVWLITISIPVRAHAHAHTHDSNFFSQPIEIILFNQNNLLDIHDFLLYKKLTPAPTRETEQEDCSRTRKW